MMADDLWRTAILSSMPRTETSPAEVAIIGAGPIGIEMAAGLKHMGVPYIHFEAGTIGTTMLWWAPFTRFFSSPERIEICGVPIPSIDQEKTTREEYLAYLRAVVRQFNLPIHTFTRVNKVERIDNQFIIHTAASAHGVGDPSDDLSKRLASKRGTTDEQMWRVNKLVLAIGNMHRPRLLNVPGEDLPHVSHYFQDPHLCFGRRVLIVGGRNSAAEAAIRLYRAGAHVAISYRRPAFDSKRVKYWLRPELEWLISKMRIQFFPETLVRRIDTEVELVRASDCAPAGSIEADHILILTGYVQDCELFEQLGIEVEGEERAPVFNPMTMETSVPGVFIAGTAASGSPARTTLFIENTHIHIARIVRAMTGAELPWPSGDEYSALAES